MSKSGKSKREKNPDEIRRPGETRLRREIIETALAMSRSGLSPGRSGNVSAHTEGGMLITPTGLACFAYMTLVPMGLCYLTWFETLRRLPATSASTGMLLVPVIGVVSATLILGEPLGLREIAAMVLTLGGVMLALQRA